MNSWDWLKERYDLTDEGAVCYEWQYRFAGEFQQALMEAIMKADDSNLYRLAKGFPVEVEAFKLYLRKDDWWSKIQAKVEAKVKTEGRADKNV